MFAFEDRRTEGYPRRIGDIVSMALANNTSGEKAARRSFTHGRVSPVFKTQKQRYCIPI